MKEIDVFLTGGTIDSKISAVGIITPRKNSAIPKHLKGLNLECKFKFHTICMKDSRDLNPKDLEKLVEGLSRSKNNLALVFHGTYTIANTAKELGENKSLEGKTIILVGAMEPLKSNKSKGPQAIIRAIEELSSLAPGVYIIVDEQFLTQRQANLLH
jgi:L-asparaginase